jgi:hypothetical protein
LVGRKRKRGRRKNTELEGQLMGRGLHKKTVELIDYIKANILKNERKMIRRIYYALEAHQYITASSKNYQMVKNAIKMARFHGLIHPNQILIDNARKSSVYVNKTTLAHNIINTLSYKAYSYSVNFWDYSNYYIEVWQEKEAMNPEFKSICNKYNIKLETGKGDQSIQVIWYAMKRWDLFLSADKKIVVLYFGDFNPSGLHAPIAIQNTISKLAEAWKSEFKNDFSKVEFKRVGLNLEHVKKYHLPENPTKKTTHKDKVIAKRFIRKFGDINVEMESLAESKKYPLAFTKMVNEAIEEYVDEKAQKKAAYKENTIIPRLEKIINTMKNNYLEKEEE